MVISYPKEVMIFKEEWKRKLGQTSIGQNPDGTFSINLAGPEFCYFLPSTLKCLGLIIGYVWDKSASLT